ncbi:MAG: hypothetical protein LBS84_03325 [Clostridiales bacterium]|nr:hypothetical protein [Clostridiales bacterium]
MEKLLAAVSDIELGGAGGLSLGLLIICAVCGLYAGSSKSLSSENKTAAAIFIESMVIVLFEMTILAFVNPRSDRLFTAIVAAEIILLTVFTLCAAISILLGVNRYDDEDDDEVTGGAYERHVPQGLEPIYYILPDMPDEEIELQLTTRNSE